jgi:hypothetical protein
LRGDPPAANRRPTCPVMTCPWRSKSPAAVEPVAHTAVLRAPTNAIGARSAVQAHPAAGVPRAEHYRCPISLPLPLTPPLHGASHARSRWPHGWPTALLLIVGAAHVDRTSSGFANTTLTWSYTMWPSAAGGAWRSLRNARRVITPSVRGGRSGTAVRQSPRSSRSGID